MRYHVNMADMQCHRINHMGNKITFIKATIIGGVVFLVPFFVVFILVGKLVGVLKTVAASLAPFIPIESIPGVVVLNILALAAILGACFLAGLAAQRAAAHRASSRIETVLHRHLPGYSFIKVFVESMRKSDELAQSFIPVFVRFDDYAQQAFEIERIRNEWVVVYLPGTPNPWSGSVLYVTPDRVQPLSMTVAEALATIRMLGKGSAAYSERTLRRG